MVHRRIVVNDNYIKLVAVFEEGRLANGKGIF